MIYAKYHRVGSVGSNRLLGGLRQFGVRQLVFAPASMRKLGMSTPADAQPLAGRQQQFEANRKRGTSRTYASSLASSEQL